ncbi:hypothetical protein [Amycolatopsis saalfeldensis]|uniref:Uncharacterized protein n=1 Tax=Amycolatopsis saalfeldensis TaxID=394193 RepID=A0A1H8Y400_9PSEU|nr:hypothetical protein [Amycolatopsis saalfeldensis]SEP47020.1 hypothetical protein SAMN04489732_11119 [Amycolatopsis saalfeldensis]
MARGLRRAQRLKIDKVIRARLDDEFLAELTANLWIVDCQTCGRALGPRRPALVIAECAGVAEATLHHAGCQDSRWEAVEQLPRFAGSPSWRSGGFAVPGTGALVFLVNPTCEAALLAATGTGWRLGSLDVFLRAGMRTGSLDPLPMPSGFTAVLGQGTLTVSYEAGGAPLARWWIPSDDGGLVDRTRTVVLGLTTAVDVTTGTTMAVLRSLVERRQAAVAVVGVGDADSPS